MPRLANMLGAVGRVEIPVEDDEPLVVEYRRSALTPRLQARIANLQRAANDPARQGELDGDAVLAVCDVYARVIVAWNLTDDGGALIGTDAESLADVAFSTLNLVFDAIGREVAPDPLSGSGSSNGSSPTADSAPLLSITGS